MKKVIIILILLVLSRFCFAQADSNYIRPASFVSYEQYIEDDFGNKYQTKDTIKILQHTEGGSKLIRLTAGKRERLYKLNEVTNRSEDGDLRVITFSAVDLTTADTEVYIGIAVSRGLEILIAIAEKDKVIYYSIYQPVATIKSN